MYEYFFVVVMLAQLVFYVSNIPVLVSILL